MGSGLLPTHIPHSVHDVASVFKKLIAGLSGGLLGSILLFKALRSITDHLHPNPELPDSQNTKTRASLIALAISSVTSSLRVSLIWAVLGLAALIGHEAEKAEQADKIAGKDGERQRRVSFELMGYRSLGVVLGPLLLGDLTDQVAVSDENERGGLLVLPGNTKQRRKEKKKEKGQDNKLEQSSDLIAHVDRANVTARVMEMLIGNWQEVVKQLRIINATRNGGLLATSESRQGLVSANSKLTMRPSEEELLFEFLRGRPSNGDFERSMKIKKRVKISSTSPSSHRAIWATDSSQGSRYSKKSSGIASRKNVGKHTVDEIREVADVSDTDEAPQDVSKGESAKLLTYSALASPGPAGLVLQHPFTSRDLERDNILESCENAAELVDTQASLLPSTYQFIGYPLPEADLPNITAPQVAVTTSHPENGVAKTDYQEEEQAPEQQYIDQVPLPSMTAEHRQTHPAQAARVETELTKQSHADNSISPTSAATNSHAEEPRLLVPIRHNSVRQLAQLFGTAPTCPERKGRSLDIPPLKHQAYARHLSADSTTPAPPSPTAPRSPLQLPTQSPSADKSTPRSAHDSLIPKPVLDLGRGRQPVSRSPSPTRSPLPPNRTSVISIPADRKPGPDSPRTTSRSLSRTKTPLPTTLHAITPPRRIHSTGPPTRRPNPDTFPAPKLVPLTAHARVALSAESLLRVRAALEGPPIAYRLRTTRSMSSERSSVQGPVQRAGFGTDAETDPATTTSALTYPPATNATLHASIRRLHLALAAKSEEATQARRSLDAVREAREGMGADGVKGTLSEEVREARREAGMWRRRAEWAEARLLALGLEGAVGEEVGGEDGGVRVKGEEGGEMQTEGGVSVNRCNERGEKGKGQEGGKMETEGGVSVNRCNERGEMTAGDVLEVQVRWDGA